MHLPLTTTPSPLTIYNLIYITYHLPLTTVPFDRIWETYDQHTYYTRWLTNINHKHFVFPSLLGPPWGSPPAGLLSLIKTIAAVSSLPQQDHQPCGMTVIRAEHNCDGYGHKLIRDNSARALHTLLSLDCNEWCTVRSKQCTFITTHFTVHTKNCTVHTTHCTDIIAHCTVHT